MVLTHINVFRTRGHRLKALAQMTSTYTSRDGRLRCTHKHIFNKIGPTKHSAIIRHTSKPTIPLMSKQNLIESTLDDDGTLDFWEGASDNSAQISVAHSLSLTKYKITIGQSLGTVNLLSSFESLKSFPLLHAWFGFAWAFQETRRLRIPTRGVLCSARLKKVPIQGFSPAKNTHSR